MIRLAAAALVALAPLPSALPAGAPPAGRVVVAFVPDLAPGTPVPGAAVGALVVVTARHPLCPADAWLTLSAGARAAAPHCAAPSLADWPAIVHANDERHHDAHPGALAGALAKDGRCIGATGPLAALGAADRAGTVGSPTCAVQFVDGGSDVAEIDRTLRPDVLVLISLPRPGHLGAVALRPGNGVLRGSTRRDGLVTLTDITDWLRDGSHLTAVPGDAGDVRDLAEHEHDHRRLNGLYLFGFPVVCLLLLAAHWRAARRAALVAAAYPLAGFLWPATGPLAAVALVVAPLATPLVLAATVVAVFAGDLLTGGHLQQTGIASYSAVAGGRFYGLGNIGFAVFATAAVVACGAAARRYGRIGWLGLLPVLVLVAGPAWGADFGGAVAVTAALVAAVATRRRTALLGCLAGLAVAVGVALLDAQRPAADRTHLGRFVAGGDWWDTLARKAAAATHSVTGTYYPVVVAVAVAVAVRVLRRLRDPGLDPTVRALAVLWVVGSLVNDSGIAVAGAGLALAVPLLVAHAARPADAAAPAEPR